MASGLYDDQAKIYEILLKNGPLPAGKIANISQITRSLVYRVLEELEAKGLVTKEEEAKKVAIFTPAHPLNLQVLAEKMERKAKNAQIALDSILPSLSSEFNLMTGRPNIQFYEGLSGLQKIYDDILRTNKDFLLIRAGEEPVYITQVIPELLDKFIKKRVRQDIYVDAITPIDQLTEDRKINDQKNLYNRTAIPKNDYTAPVEINIYGDKVAILSYGKELIGFIIESPQIAQSLKQLFSLIKKGAMISSNNQE